jgi:type IV secretion system protein VirB9
MRCIAAALLLSSLLASLAAAAAEADPRLRELRYDPRAVVSVPVKRGMVTLVVLDADEAIAEVAAGLGSDCAKPELPWCVAAQPGGRHLFVKAKSGASAPNTLAVVTDRRAHNLRFVVLADSDPRPPVYRLTIRAPVAPPPMRPVLREPLPDLPPIPAGPTPEQQVAERLQALPQVLNTQYAVAEGAHRKTSCRRWCSTTAVSPT